jgi:hypothetical protein
VGKPFNTPEPLLFMGLIGASIARNSKEIWYSDGSPKAEIDLFRIPWVRDHIRERMRARWRWKDNHGPKT